MHAAKFPSGKRFQSAKTGDREVHPIDVAIGGSW